MKAQSFFGGTKPKDGASKVRQVGHIGKVQSKTGSLPIRETVKQVRPEAAEPNITWVNSKQPKIGKSK